MPASNLIHIDLFYHPDADTKPPRAEVRECRVLHEPYVVLRLRTTPHAEAVLYLSPEGLEAILDAGRDALRELQDQVYERAMATAVPIVDENL